MPGDEKRPCREEFRFCVHARLAGLGWIDGRNVRIELRWGGGDINRIRAFAQELAGLQPDVILTNTTAPIVVLRRETRTIPIVFASAADPVA